VLENVNDGHNMETYFPFEIEPPETEVELTSNYEDMIVAILSQTPDPRFNDE